MNSLHCHTAIIGAGAAGLSLAAGLSQLGLSVILIERGLMGGDCLNYGCVPSKALLASAKNFWQARHSQALGLINFASPREQLDFHQVMQHVHQTIQTLAVHDSVERFESLGVKVIQAQARFVDKKPFKQVIIQLKPGMLSLRPAHRQPYRPYPASMMFLI